MIEFFRSTGQEQIADRNGLHIVEIPMKGRLRALDPLSASSDPARKVVYKQFVIDELTTSESDSATRTLLRQTKCAKHLYLDSLIKVSELNLVPRLAASSQSDAESSVLYGNRLDHSTDLDLHFDYVETVATKGTQPDISTSSPRHNCRPGFTGLATQV